MREFLALLKARNIEFYRDRAGLAWAFIFPVMIIIGCAVAFSNPDESVFKVGIVGNIDDYQQPNLLNENYIKVFSYASEEKAIERIKYHQIDLLINKNSSKRYWINSESSRGEVIEKLFLASTTDYSKQTLSGRAVRYVDWVIPGVLGMNLMFGALFGVGYVIVRYRRNGVLKRLQATPISARQFLSAQMVSRLLVVVVVNVLIFFGCALFLDLIVLGSYFSLLVITMLGGLALSAIGLLVASRTSNEELAGGLLNMASWPMLFLSEVWFSLDNSPDWMKWLADLLPLTHIVKSFREVMIEGATLADVSYHLIWLLALTVVCIVLAGALFRWNDSR